MDGTKRKASPYSDSIDLGVATPTWTDMTDYPVSALRYTQSPYALPAKRRNSFQTREEAIRAISPITIDDDSSSSSSSSEARSNASQYEYEVDTDNDGVWLTNTGEHTFSGTLASENDPIVQATLPPQVEIALLRLKQAQRLAELDAKKHDSDRILRDLVRDISNRLKAGASLTLERLAGDSSITITCADPFCPGPEHKIAAGAYYFILGQPRQLQDAQHYCLFCLEEMWDGKGMVGPLPHPSIWDDFTEAQSTTTVALQSDLDGLALDGTVEEEEHKALQRYLSGDCKACRSSLLNKFPPEEVPGSTSILPAPDDDNTTIPSSLLESRWAPKATSGDDETRPQTPEAQVENGGTVLPQSPETPGGPYSPVVRERTRFQFLAGYVRAGESLDGREKEGVRGWKEGGGCRGKELSVVLGGLRE
ncbi:hypothetical protein LTR78_009148 [Recurvomyces mirabilis]|uniref:Uncharacterized protein n=1 Tax=Recurvomyces mirabilis TaxID=574656 RepID=A0AAE0TPY2_9PEZI|nr:hypothetical protein LTR78_009148 [Recurvomyces mirabilis]KAK5161084.1 hypothetical protein LTS14_000880 [Recurvomyces mirabilis]